MSNYTADELDAAAAAVLVRYPNLTGPAFVSKTRRVAAIFRHSQRAETWTAAS